MTRLIIAIGLAAGLVACTEKVSSSAPADGSTPAAAPTSGTASAPATSPSTDPAAPKAASPAAEPGAATAAAAPAAALADDNKPEFREVTIPAGTTLPLTLRTSVGSDTSKVEDQVRATLRTPIRIQGTQALPAETAFIGHVTDAERSGRVKGRARIAFRFTRADLPGEGEALNVRTSTVSRLAPATKKRDAATIGGGAVGGAIIGGIVGGGSGAAKGATIGGAGGTGVVLATRGKEVRLPAGTAVNVKLSAPLTVRVPVK